MRGLAHTDAIRVCTQTIEQTANKKFPVLLKRADNKAAYEKTAKRVATVIPHQTYSLDPVLPSPKPRSNCYIEWMLKVGEAASLLKHTEIIDLIARNPRHMEIIQAVRTNGLVCIAIRERHFSTVVMSRSADLV